MIQSIITRLAGNSFLFKGWSATLIAAVTAYIAKDKVPQVAWFVLGPAIAFLFIDAYYLMLEKAFRNHFAKVAAAHLKPEMDAVIPAFDMKIELHPSLYYKALLSPAIWLFYLPILAMIVAVAVLGPGWVPGATVAGK
jgi:hypothetical protein